MEAAEKLYLQALDQLAEGAPGEAAEDFRAALALDPGYGDARHGLVRALQDQGAYEEALSQAQALAADAPEDVLALTAISILYQRMGRIPEAEEAATRAKLLGWKLDLRAKAK